MCIIIIIIIIIRKLFVQFTELHLLTVVNFSQAILTNESVTDQSFLCML